MNRVFVDASVLFAAAYSKQGAARELLRRHLNEEIELLISDSVVDEARRNLTKKAPPTLPIFDALLTALELERVEPTREEILAAADYTVSKDAAVVAAALNGNARYLVTFDRRHLINPEQVAERSGLIILTPGELLSLL